MNPNPDIELILASASPRRKELIATLGLPFQTIPSRYEEPSAPNYAISLPDFVMFLASQKALEVATRIKSLPLQHPAQRWVIGADTLVSLEEGVGKPLGKPIDEADAIRMLTLLSGREHYVYTGIALIRIEAEETNSEPICRVVKTKVRFRELSNRMIQNYVRTGEPMDKAGSYGAQGFAAPLIERFEGDFFNVVGLPLCELGKLLEECGVEWGR